MTVICADCGKEVARPAFDGSNRPHPFHRLCLAKRRAAERAVAAATSGWLGKQVTWARTIQNRQKKTVVAQVVGLSHSGALVVEFELAGKLHRQTINPDYVRVVGE